VVRVCASNKFDGKRTHHHHCLPEYSYIGEFGYHCREKERDSLNSTVKIAESEAYSKGFSYGYSFRNTM
jgi:hypothetical protein